MRQRAHPDLNQGPADLQSAALTTELCTHLLDIWVQWSLHERYREITEAGNSKTAKNDQIYGYYYKYAVYYGGIYSTLAPLAQWLERWSYEP